jgi:hypothetical protein
VQLPLKTILLNRVDQQKTSGEIRRLTDDHLEQWDKWHYSQFDEDSQWNWREIYRESQFQPSLYECYAVTAQGRLEGMARLDLQNKQIASGRTITLDYLATNPANRLRNHGLKYIGLALIGAAITRSMEMGAGGALWLESLAGAAAFYEHLGMTKQTELSLDGYDIYVLDATHAQGLLEKLHAEGILAL